MPSLRRNLTGLGMLALLAGCGGSQEASQNAGGEVGVGRTLTVAALQIQSGPGGPGTPASRTLTGNFEIRSPHPGEQSVHNATTGGACMIAQVPTTPKTCTQNSDCDIAAGQSPPAFFGYCNSGTCWVKANGAAGRKYCVKGVGEGAHQIPAFYPNEVYDYVASQSAGRAAPVKWAVFGCLNGPVPDPTKPPCGGYPGVSMHDEGNSRTVP